VANTQQQFGFQPFQSASGVVPNFGYTRRTILESYNVALFRGDPVALNSSGQVVIASSQSAPVLGIFWGCEYTTNSPLTALPVKSKYWPGVSLANTALIVTAWVIEDPDILFLAAELGSTRAIAQGDVGNNVQWAAGSGGSTATGISSYVIDDGNFGNTITLPFKIMDLYSTTACPGVNGADNTTVYNWAVVKMNYSYRTYGSIGI
jgi:hypothetical protein